jgi:hypothetical protein
MKRSFPFAIAALVLVLALPAQGFSGVEKLVGKWLAKAVTPNGPVEIEFDLKLDGDKLAGTAAMFQGSIPLSAIKFDDPKLTIELSAGQQDFRLSGTLKDDRFEGTWEQVGGDMKGTWSAERKGPAPVAAAANGGVSGTWSLVAVTPQGELPLTMEVKEAAGKVTGSLSSAMGVVAIESGTYASGKLGFDLNIGAVYHVDLDVVGDKITGKWGQAGTDGGAVTGTRKGGTTAPAAAEPQIDGDWDARASSPEGVLTFTLTLKRDGSSLSATLSTPEGSMAGQNASCAAGKVSFEVEYMGGRYRIESTVSGNKLTGRWTEVGASNTGDFSAERKTSKP